MCSFEAVNRGTVSMFLQKKLIRVSFISEFSFVDKLSFIIVKIDIISLSSDLNSKSISSQLSIE